MKLKKDYEYSENQHQIMCEQLLKEQQYEQNKEVDVLIK